MVVGLFALILITTLIVMGFFFLLAHVGDIFVAGGTVGLLGVVAVVLGGYVTIRRTEREIVIQKRTDSKPPITVSENLTVEVRPERVESNWQSAQGEPQPESLEATSGLYASKELALDDALGKLAVEIDQEINANNELPAGPGEIKEYLRTSEATYQYHDEAKERDLGDGIVATMHQVNVSIPLTALEAVRWAMERWLAWTRSIQTLIALGATAVSFLVLGGILSLFGRRPAPAPGTRPMT